MAAPIPKLVPKPAAPPQQVKPPTVLLMGPPGTGKTDAIASMLEAGLEVFAIIIEPNGLDSLLDSCARRKVSTDLLHWRYIPPASMSVDALVKMVDQVSKNSYADLTRLSSGIGKDETRQLMEVLNTFKNFVDDKDGTEYGSIFSFDETRAVAMDSLSGLNMMAKDLTVGYRPTLAEGEWGVAMEVELKIIQMLCSDLKCFFVLTAHIEKEQNEITGGLSITSAALGKKNAGRIARLFSEIVLTKRTKDGRKFLWSTWETASLVDLKSRALPISDALEPTFKQVTEAHQRRLLQITHQKEE